VHLCRVVTSVGVVGYCIISGNMTLLASPSIQGLFTEGFAILLESAFVLPVFLILAIEAIACWPRVVGLASVAVAFSVFTSISTSVSMSSSGLLPDMGFMGAAFSCEGMSFGNGACSIWI